MRKKSTKTAAESELLCNLIIQGMVDRKAQDIVLLDLRKVRNSMADFFIICSGTSDTQVDAITDSVEDVVTKNSGQNPWHREGKTNKEWILLDYFDCVAHIFKKAKREFYALEMLWGDATITHFGEDGQIITAQQAAKLQTTHNTLL